MIDAYVLSPCRSHAREIRDVSAALSHLGLHLSCCHTGGMLAGDKLIVFHQNERRLFDV